ncbi:MAG: hypothetical protein JWP40_1318 [Blastococcus sp.]|nr:hypothetical protein [Blastococcus sp.]
MPDRQMPVSGPHRIYVEAIPTGARLDITAYLETAVLALIRDHLDELNDLAELDVSAQHQISTGNSDSYAGHERDARIEELVAGLSPQLPVYGPQVAKLADALHQIARPKGLPGQRQGGAAA